MLAFRPALEDMADFPAGRIAPPPPLDGGLTPLAKGSRGWTAWVSTAISATVLIAVIYQLSGLDFARIAAMVPVSPAFWLTFLIAYLLLPVCDWIIFRRLWKIPAKGIVALIRKTVSNELLVSYLGEVQFYSWARRHGRLSAAPFGAIKDVAILSALAGNAVTLAMLAIASPLLFLLPSNLPFPILGLSLAALVVTSAVPMLWRQRVFSLPRDQLWFVFKIHCVRLLLTTGFAAVLWILVLPALPLAWLILLATIRLLIGRLPFMPNKELVFAGFAALLVGSGNDIASLIAMLAGLTLVTHMAFGALSSAYDLRSRRAR